MDENGWTKALVQASIASAGTADSFVKASHITRYVHQVTAASLWDLLQQAYQQSTLEVTAPFEEWCLKQAEEKLFEFLSLQIDKIQINVLSCLSMTEQVHVLM